MSTIKIDYDKMKDTINCYKKSIETLNTDLNILNSNIKMLKNEWKGQAQEAFFSNIYQNFEKAMKNIKPALEVKSRRVGGSNYQVPIEVTPARSQALALRWLTKYSRERGGKGMADNLANEILDASNGTGAAVKKREDTHRMAEANKAFAHYRW